jgi:cell division protein FtsI/penicillin-binding protein 2
MKTDLSNKMMKSRLGVLFIIFVIIFTYLIIRLGVITFVENENYNQRVLYQYISRQTMSDSITPKRGEILDRNGIVLAENVQVYNVVFDPNGTIAQPESVRKASIAFIAEHIEGVDVSLLESYLVDFPSVKYKLIGKGYYFDDILEDAKALAVEAEKLTTDKFTVFNLFNDRIADNFVSGYLYELKFLVLFPFLFDRYGQFPKRFVAEL